MNHAPLTTPSPENTREVTLDRLARPGGGLAMVAMDQRESLRTMFEQAGAGRPSTEVLVEFKLAVARPGVHRDRGSAWRAQRPRTGGTCHA